jgi:tetratricopeptide (TPR) repeat protein/transcriptional regulator with XRE-family HTH domain/ubiquinone/menaquinone biosynthesis C-methylase UbiE
MKKSSLARPNIRLKEERELRGWSQKYVADAIDADRYYLSRWEHGTASPSPYYRQKLCVLFGKNARELGLLPAEDTIEQSTSVTAPESVPAPRNPFPVHDPTLPPPMPGNAHLIGRDETIQKLRKQLIEGKGVVLTAINGLPGVGKTTLAVELAHDAQVQEHFQDGVLWAGLGPTPDVFAILNHWSGLLGISSSQTAKIQSVEEWSRVLQVAVGQRRLLLVIDDVWRIEAALAFKVGGPHIAYLITTRFPNIALHFTDEAGEAVVLKELSVDDGLALLARLAPEVVQSEPESARTLVQAVGGLPLALTLMGKYLRTQEYGKQPRRIRAALERLRIANERLLLTEPLSPLERPPGLAQSMPLSLQTIIAVSERQLEEQEQMALRALSAFPAKPNSFSEEAALAVSQVPVESLDVLCDSGLLEYSGPGRYTLHQTITDYAQASFKDVTVYERMADYYTGFVEQHGKQFDVLEAETANIFSALDAAYTYGMHRSYARCVNALFHFLFTRGLYLEEAGKHIERALTIARNQQDDELLASLLLSRGKMVYKNGNYALAEESLNEARVLAARLQNVPTLSDTLMMLGSLARFRTSRENAVTYLSESLELARQVGDPELISNVLGHLGSALSDQGSYQEAEAYNKEGAELARSIGNQDRLAQLLYNLSTLAIFQGRFEEGERYGLEGLELARQVGFMDAICKICTNLGALTMDLGDFAKAEMYFKEALEVARRIGDAKVVSADLGSLGSLAQRQGRYYEATTYLQEALSLARQVGDTWLLSAILNECGELALKLRDLDAAAAVFQEAADYSAQGSKDEVASAYYGLARVALARANTEEARLHGRKSLSIFETTGHRQKQEVERWMQDLPGEEKSTEFEGIDILTCPYCSAPLSQVDTALKCERGHSFDIAREGYVNLMPGKHPGDAKEMLLARRAFLEAGYYQPLSDAINAIVGRHLSIGNAHSSYNKPQLPAILDAGCGEGYYLGRLHGAFSHRFPRRLIGMDISKEAIRMAAKRYREALFVVADLKQRFVLEDQSVAVTLNIFAPRNPPEFARVLVPGGMLLVVIPTQEHLLSLRTLLGLLTIQEQKEQQVVEQFAGQFELIESETMAYSLRLNKAAIEQVVMMTPNYWHVNDEMRQVMQDLEEVETEAAFRLLVFRKR